MTAYAWDSTPLKWYTKSMPRWNKNERMPSKEQARSTAACISLEKFPGIHLFVRLDSLLLEVLDSLLLLVLDSNLSIQRPLLSYRVLIVCLVNIVICLCYLLILCYGLWLLAFITLLVCTLLSRKSRVL